MPRTNKLNILISSVIFLGFSTTLAIANNEVAGSKCNLGQVDCPLPPNTSLQIPVAAEHGNHYQCAFRSAAKGHRISFRVTGVEGFIYPSENIVIADERGLVPNGFLKVSGTFQDLQGKGYIRITNQSIYDGLLSCSKTCSLPMALPGRS